MKLSKSIRIKAAFLALVFALNPVIGFACSIDINMGFNSGHRLENHETEAVVHIHKDGKKHIHYEEKQDREKPHAHHGGTKKHSEEKDKNCCNDQVKKFEELDKSLPHALYIVHPIFLISFFDAYYSVDLPAILLVKNIKQFLRNDHPPITDIRIAIQSFQI